LREASKVVACGLDGADGDIEFYRSRHTNTEGLFLLFGSNAQEGTGGTRTSEEHSETMCKS
jgi:hypothetical protein